MVSSRFQCTKYVSIRSFFIFHPKIIQGLGCEMDERRCRTLISVYDLNGSGGLETEEFVTWMMLEHVRVRELLSCGT